MRPPSRNVPGTGAAGLTLVEVLIALLVISIGILAVVKLLPASSRSQVASRMESVAGQYASEQFEKLRGLSKTHASLSLGRHPSADYDSLGTLKSWQRYYVVTQMPAPLDSLLKVDVAVQWKSSKAESLRMSGYLYP